jgi:hypothetical protein
MIKLLVVICAMLIKHQQPVWYVLDCFTRNHTGVFTNVPPGQHIVWVEIKFKETITYTVTVYKASDMKILLNTDSTKLHVIITKK